ncbi:tetratricopeptide repeat protein [Lonepinella sp. MS14436]|uniref:tetratricopeptide repeat protein n=1 Tax=Lonepinella sp. MS14436 TaxID=3003619 RepID=UPI0036DC6FF0
MFKKLLLATLIGMSFPTSSYANEINDLTTKAEAGDFFSQISLGFKYEIGEEVEKDPVKAVYWYQKAAEQGDATAQFNLALKYYDGQGVRQDKRLAKELFGQSCDNGYQRGCNNYRKLNEQGY